MYNKYLRIQCSYHLNVRVLIFYEQAATFYPVEVERILIFGIYIIKKISDLVK